MIFALECFIPLVTIAVIISSYSEMNVKSNTIGKKYAEYKIIRNHRPYMWYRYGDAHL